jgi:hypothetical protein
MLVIVGIKQGGFYYFSHCIFMCKTSALFCVMCNCDSRPWTLKLDNNRLPTSLMESNDMIENNYFFLYRKLTCWLMCIWWKCYANVYIYVYMWCLAMLLL